MSEIVDLSRPQQQWQMRSDVLILLQHLDNYISTMSQWLSRFTTVTDGDATMTAIDGLHMRQLPWYRRSTAPCIGWALLRAPDILLVNTSYPLTFYSYKHRIMPLGWDRLWGCAHKGTRTLHSEDEASYGAVSMWHHSAPRGGPTAAGYGCNNHLVLSRAISRSLTKLRSSHLEPRISSAR